MRRGYLIAAGVAALLLLALLGVVAVDRATAPDRGRKARPRVPRVVAGQSARAPLPDRDPELDASAVVRCTWEGDGPAGALIAMGPGGEPALAEGERTLALTLAPGRWRLVWEKPEGGALPLGEVTLEAGETRTCTLSEEGWDVEATVRAPDGRRLEQVLVSGCGTHGFTDADGHFAFRTRRSGCAVRAWWRDGLLSRRSAPVVVDAFGAGHIELEVDDAPVAGLGIGFEPETDGVRVTTVHPGSPAAAAGLEAGDLVVEVDGADVAGVDVDRFVALGTGEEGSTAVVEVVRDGEPRTFRVPRARLSRQSDTG